MIVLGSGAHFPFVCVCVCMHMCLQAHRRTVLRMTNDDAFGNRIWLKCNCFNKKVFLNLSPIPERTSPLFTKDALKGSVSDRWMELGSSQS